MRRQVRGDASQPTGRALVGGWGRCDSNSLVPEPIHFEQAEHERDAVAGRAVVDEGRTSHVDVHPRALEVGIWYARRFPLTGSVCEVRG